MRKALLCAAAVAPERAGKAGHNAEYIKMDCTPHSTAIKYGAASVGRYILVRGISGPHCNPATNYPITAVGDSAAD